MNYKNSADRLMKHFASSSGAGPIYLVKTTQLGGSGNPLDPGDDSESKTLLKDSLFIKNIKHSEQGRTDIKYDRILMTKGENALSVNDVVEVNGERFVVVDTDPIAPGTNGDLVHKNYLSVT